MQIENCENVYFLQILSTTFTNCIRLVHLEKISFQLSPHIYASIKETKKDYKIEIKKLKKKMF